jgi:glycerol-3-phosphate dehydrogenase
MVGLETFKIKPRKGEEYLIDKKCEGLVKRVIFPLPDDKSKGTLIIPTLDGTIMVGPSAEDVIDKRDWKTTDDICWEIFQKAKSMVPKLDMSQLISAFAGLRPVAYGPRGDDFIIEKNSVKGFINAAGIQSPGLTAAPAIAELVLNILREDGLTLKKKDHFIASNPPVYKLREVSKEKLGELHKQNPDWGCVVCRCEMVSMAEIKNAVHMGAKTLDGVKFRTRAGMGRCQGGFCSFKTIEIMAHELKVSPLAITKKGPGSEILVEDRGLK